MVAAVDTGKRTFPPSTAGFHSGSISWSTNPIQILNACTICSGQLSCAFIFARLPDYASKHHPRKQRTRNRRHQRILPDAPVCKAVTDIYLFIIDGLKNKISLPPLAMKPFHDIYNYCTNENV